MNNQTLLTRSLQSVWHPCTQMKQHENYPLIPIERGDGVWLYDKEGMRYLDAVSSWWVNLFGHNNPRIKNAIKQQLDTLEHVMLAGFTHEPVVELSEKLSKLTGLSHAFYASDGASAAGLNVAGAQQGYSQRATQETHALSPPSQVVFASRLVRLTLHRRA